MLVLGRSRGDRIVLDNGVVITVVDVRGHTVRIGVEAPESVRIVRGELIQEKDRGSDRPNDGDVRGLPR
jgi:carbon storage regulator